jgi:hypothetical protein
MPDLSLWPANADFDEVGGEEERFVERVPVWIPDVEGQNEVAAAAADPDGTPDDPDESPEDQFIFVTDND